MGSILDAFQEGYHPKARPMNTETPTARAMASGEEAVAQFNAAHDDIEVVASFQSTDGLKDALKVAASLLRSMVLHFLLFILRE